MPRQDSNLCTRACTRARKQRAASQKSLQRRMFSSTSSRVTRGDAEAIFEAFGSGGWAVFLKGGTVEGAPADFLPGSLARISPALHPGEAPSVLAPITFFIDAPETGTCR